MITSKDVRLPVQLQRAMAAEAEAAREARAKVGGHDLGDDGDDLGLDAGDNRPRSQCGNENLEL